MILGCNKILRKNSRMNRMDMRKENHRDRKSGPMNRRAKMTEDKLEIMNNSNSRKNQKDQS
jgi:hypothetical protein